MRILHITPSYKPAFHYGGPTVSVSRLAEEQARLGFGVTVYTTTANGPVELKLPAGRPRDVEDVIVWYFKRWTGDHGHFSPALLWRLWRDMRTFDVIHIHSWWNWVAFGAAFLCRMRRFKPVVLSPRGMLSAYSHQGRGRALFQRTLGRWLLRPLVLHGTSAQETKELGEQMPGQTTFTLPNIIDLPKPAWYGNRPENPVFRLLFLSRIHPKKGLDLLLDTLKHLEAAWQLSIAGDGDAAYCAELKEKIRRSGMEERVEWLGWLEGAEKLEALVSADLFVLPSLHENFANVVLEALAVGTAVLVSDQVGLSAYIETNKLGWVTALRKKALLASLQTAQADRAGRRRIRRNAPEQIWTDFRPRAIARQYLEQYDRLIKCSR